MKISLLLTNSLLLHIHCPNIHNNISTILCSFSYNLSISVFCFRLYIWWKMIKLCEKLSFTTPCNKCQIHLTVLFWWTSLHLALTYKYVEDITEWHIFYNPTIRTKKGSCIYMHQSSYWIKTFLHCKYIIISSNNKHTSHHH